MLSPCEKEMMKKLKKAAIAAAIVVISLLATLLVAAVFDAIGMEEVAVAILRLDAATIAIGLWGTGIVMLVLHRGAVGSLLKQLPGLFVLLLQLHLADEVAESEEGERELPKAVIVLRATKGSTVIILTLVSMITVGVKIGHVVPSMVWILTLVVLAIPSAMDAVGIAKTTTVVKWMKRLWCVCATASFIWLSIGWLRIISAILSWAGGILEIPGLSFFVGTVWGLPGELLAILWLAAATALLMTTLDLADLEPKSQPGSKKSGAKAPEKK